MFGHFAKVFSKPALRTGALAISTVGFSGGPNTWCMFTDPSGNQPGNQPGGNVEGGDSASHFVDVAPISDPFKYSLQNSSRDMIIGARTCQWNGLERSR